VNAIVFMVAESNLAMKHNKNHDNAPSPGLQLVPVCFEFTHPTATTVCLAGTFNNWKPESKVRHSSSTGRWWKEIALAPGSYEYCLVVDGKWMPDPLARETVSNPFGGRNSVLKVASSPEAAHLANAENLPFKNTKE
jgi:1,4-alpha-glucan branching enzyme